MAFSLGPEIRPTEVIIDLINPQATYGALTRGQFGPISTKHILLKLDARTVNQLLEPAPAATKISDPENPTATQLASNWLEYFMTAVREGSIESISVVYDRTPSLTGAGAGAGAGAASGSARFRSAHDSKFEEVIVALDLANKRDGKGRTKLRAITITGKLTPLECTYLAVRLRFSWCFLPDMTDPTLSTNFSYIANRELRKSLSVKQQTVLESRSLMLVQTQENNWQRGSSLPSLADHIGGVFLNYNPVAPKSTAAFAVSVDPEIEIQIGLLNVQRVMGSSPLTTNPLYSSEHTALLLRHYITAAPKFRIKNEDILKLEDQITQIKERALRALEMEKAVERERQALERKIAKTERECKALEASVRALNEKEAAEARTVAEIERNYVTFRNTREREIGHQLSPSQELDCFADFVSSIKTIILANPAIGAKFDAERRPHQQDLKENLERAEQEFSLFIKGKPFITPDEKISLITEFLKSKKFQPGPARTMERLLVAPYYDPLYQRELLGRIEKLKMQKAGVVLSANGHSKAPTASLPVHGVGAASVSSIAASIAPASPPPGRPATNPQEAQLAQLLTQSAKRKKEEIRQQTIATEQLETDLAQAPQKRQQARIAIAQQEAVAQLITQPPADLAEVRAVTLDFSDSQSALLPKAKVNEQLPERIKEELALMDETTQARVLTEYRRKLAEHDDQRECSSCRDPDTRGCFLLFNTDRLSDQTLTIIYHRAKKAVLNPEALAAAHASTGAPKGPGS